MGFKINSLEELLPLASNKLFGRTSYLAFLVSRSILRESSYWTPVLDLKIEGIAIAAALIQLKNSLPSSAFEVS